MIPHISSNPQTDMKNSRSYVSAFHPEYVAEGNRAEARARSCKSPGFMGRRKAAFIGWTMGVNHSTQGAVTVAAINNLSLITGNIGRAGASPFSITGQCNAMGTRESGFTSTLPGYRKFDVAADREELARIWNIDVLSVSPLRAASPIRTSSREPWPEKLKAMWIIATNPAVSFPNYRRAATGTEKCGVSCRAGWLPSNIYKRIRASGVTCRNLGREGRYIYKLRAPHRQSESHRCSTRRGANRLRHISRSGR